MFFAHYLIPLIAYFNSEIFLGSGLALGNLIDLDHIYYRIIGKVGWFDSACSKLGEQCSFGFYPLHNYYFAIMFFGLSFLIFAKNRKIKFVGVIFFGAFLNLLFDFFHLITGFGF